MKPLTRDEKSWLHDYQRFNGNVFEIAKLRKISAQTAFERLERVRAALGISKTDPEAKRKLLAVKV